MKTVVDPLALPAILQQTAGTQLSQMAGDFRLAVVQCPDQFADAEFALSGEHEHDSGSGFVTEAFEERVGLNGHGKPVYPLLRICEFTDIPFSLEGTHSISGDHARGSRYCSSHAL
jgi:hypothetical protein